MATFAIIRTGGKQYLVSPGGAVKIEKIPGEVGAKVSFGDVLLVSEGEKVSVGMPIVSGATVKGKITAQGKHKKQIIFKMKPKKRYRVRTGHRQLFTEVMIETVSMK